jgi:16S rRNA (guanine966-N2)-methyltransferase
VAAGTRPTEARVRGALLSIWSERIQGARLLDLFAGSGAVGLEALSRGALEAVFVESSRAARAALTRNLRLAPQGSTRLLVSALPEALGILLAQGERFDLIFADPPYAWTVTGDFLDRLAGLAGPGAELALEHARRGSPPAQAPGWVRRELRRYGETALSIYALAP